MATPGVQYANLTESDETELEDWGMTVRDITPDLARRRRIKDPDGALVTGVKNAAPAAVAGLDEGDIIREVEGRRVKSAQELLAAYSNLTAAKTTRLLVKADRGSTHRMSVLEIGD